MEERDRGRGSLEPHGTCCCLRHVVCHQGRAETGGMKQPACQSPQNLQQTDPVSLQPRPPVIFMIYVSRRHYLITSTILLKGSASHSCSVSKYLISFINFFLSICKVDSHVRLINLLVCGEGLEWLVRTG
jgi:hypothetical protein